MVMLYCSQNRNSCGLQRIFYSMVIDWVPFWDNDWKTPWNHHTLFYHYLINSVIRYLHDGYHNRSKTVALFQTIYGVVHREIDSGIPLTTPTQETYFIEIAVVLERIGISRILLQISGSILILCTSKALYIEIDIMLTSVWTIAADQSLWRHFDNISLSLQYGPSECPGFYYTSFCPGYMVLLQ